MSRRSTPIRTPHPPTGSAWITFSSSGNKTRATAKKSSHPWKELHKKALQLIAARTLRYGYESSIFQGRSSANVMKEWNGIPIDHEGDDMRFFKFLRDCWRWLWQSHGHATGIDSHKWESKMEIFRKFTE
jgi:hypothetical protein